MTSKYKLYSISSNLRSNNRSSDEFEIALNGAVLRERSYIKEKLGTIEFIKWALSTKLKIAGWNFENFGISKKFKIFLYFWNFVNFKKSEILNFFGFQIKRILSININI